MNLLSFAITIEIFFMYICKLFMKEIIFQVLLCTALNCTDSHILKTISKDFWQSFCHFGYFMKKIVFLCCCALHCTDSHMLKPISKDDVGIQCEFMMCSAQRKTKIGYYVPTILYTAQQVKLFSEITYSFFFSCLFKGIILKQS